jgi:hypothetical protein
MPQLPLFVAPARPAIPPTSVASVAPEPVAKIRVHARCPASRCGGMVVDWHTPIMSADQMQAAGWRELEPNVWATPGTRPCSRYCQNQMGLSEAGALALIP